MAIFFAMLVQSGCSWNDNAEAYRMTAGGRSTEGRKIIARYSCDACHVIPGVDGANGMVGPSLAGIRHRSHIARNLPNTPENLIRWIHRPRDVTPETEMPDLGLSEQDSRDIAAYLYSLP